MTEEVMPLASSHGTLTTWDITHHFPHPNKVKMSQTTHCVVRRLDKTQRHHYLDVTMETKKTSPHKVRK